MVFLIHVCTTGDGGIPQLPASYQADLPSPEQIAARLQGWTGRDGLAMDVNEVDLDEVEP
jgi:hypothetical protein